MEKIVDVEHHKLLGVFQQGIQNEINVKVLEMKVFNGLKGNSMRCCPTLCGEVDLTCEKAIRVFLVYVGDEVLNTNPAIGKANSLGQFANPAK